MPFLDCLFGQGTELFTFAIYIYFTPQQKNLNRVRTKRNYIRVLWWFGFRFDNFKHLATDQKWIFFLNWEQFKKLKSLSTIKKCHEYILRNKIIYSRVHMMPNQKFKSRMDLYKVHACMVFNHERSLAHHLDRQKEVKKIGAHR